MCNILSKVIIKTFIHLTLGIHWILRMDSWGQEVWFWPRWCGRALAVIFTVLGSCLVGWPGKKYTYAHTHTELAKWMWPERLLTIKTMCMCYSVLCNLHTAYSLPERWKEGLKKVGEELERDGEVGEVLKEPSGILEFVFICCILGQVFFVVNFSLNCLFNTVLGAMFIS